MAARFAKMAAQVAASLARSSSVAGVHHTAGVAQRSKLLNLLCATQRPFCGSLQISSSMQNCRCFSLTASASSSASKVASVIAVEIEHEQEHYEQPGLKVPDGWDVTEKEGNSKVSLTRDFQDEVVQVDFVAREVDQLAGLVEEEDEEVEDDEDEDLISPAASMTLEVAVMKENADMALIFEVETDGEVIRILDVSLEAINDGDASSEETIDEDEDTLYGGPVFTELDEQLRTAFVDYLEERGVNAELGGFVLAYAEDKEQREYMHWLKGVQSFLKA